MPLYKIEINKNSICLKVISKESPLCSTFITIHQNYFQGLGQGTNVDVKQAVSKTRDHHCKKKNNNSFHYSPQNKIKLAYKRAHYFSNTQYYK